MTANGIKIYVPAETIENPAETIEQLSPGNIIFDFKKMITKPALKYVAIIIVKLYKYDDEYRFDIENKKDAYPIIKDFIVNKENSTELVFQVGFCENLFVLRGVIICQISVAHIGLPHLSMRRTIIHILKDILIQYTE